MDRKALWLALHMGWALAWGALVAVAPLELLLVAALPLVPLYLLGERFWIRKHGVKPALLSSLGLVSAVVFGAAMLPKSMDRPIGNAEPLPSRRVPLSAIHDLDSRFWIPAGFETAQVTLPTVRPTLRQAILAIERQTPLRCRTSYCFFGESVLSGGYVRTVHLGLPVTPPSAAAPAAAP